MLYSCSITNQKIKGLKINYFHPPLTSYDSRRGGGGAGGDVVGCFKIITIQPTIVNSRMKLAIKSHMLLIVYIILPILTIWEFSAKFPSHVLLVTKDKSLSYTFKLLK